MSIDFVQAPVPKLQETGNELGGAFFGGLAAIPAASWPEQRIAAPLLDGGIPVREIWRGEKPLASGESEGISWRRTKDMLYGVIEVDEAAFSDTGDRSALEVASVEIYARMFRLLAAQQLPGLWRVWNYLNHINKEDHGLERYRQFCRGRHDAFIAGGYAATYNVPAACAIGLSTGPLSVAFIAGATPPIAIENPRQVSAYRYPDDYGPRSPTFSRASLAYPAGREILFISGTASIVGHRTTHVGDVVAQCRESMTNVAAVVDEANRRAKGRPFTVDELAYRVYLRSAGDLAAVRASMMQLLGDTANVVFLQADICRADLLLEVEATACHQLGTSA